MKKKSLLLLFGLTLSLSLTGGGYVKAEEETQETEVSASIEPITPSDYLIADASKWVTLGDFDGIALEKNIYTITDDMVQSRIDEERQTFASEIEKEGASEEGDTVYFNLTYSVDGTDSSDTWEDYSTVIGYEEFGAEFDKELTGVSSGDQLTFTVSYPEDSDLADWAGHTVEFALDITGVTVLEVPAYDDSYLADYTDYTSKEDYEASIRESLEAEYEESSEYELKDSLLTAAADRCEFNGYPQELYDSCKEETLSFYASFIEGASSEDVMELFGMSEEDLDLQVTSEVNRRLLISAICLEKGMEVTEEDYLNSLNDMAESYGEDDIVSIEEYWGRDALVWDLYQTQVNSFLLENATITEVDASVSDDYEDDDFESLDDEDLTLLEEETETDIE